MVYGEIIQLKIKPSFDWHHRFLTLHYLLLYHHPSLFDSYFDT